MRVSFGVSKEEKEKEERKRGREKKNKILVVEPQLRRRVFIFIDRNLLDRFFPSSMNGRAGAMFAEGGRE